MTVENCISVKCMFFDRPVNGGMLLMIIVLLFANNAFAKQSDEKLCFSNCMRGGTQYPGECKRLCKNKVKQNSTATTRNKDYQQRLIENDIARQKRWEKIKKAKEAERRLEEADSSISEQSHINLICYRACHIETGQKAYCERHCKRSGALQKKEIDTGDSKLDKLIVDCYKSCAQRADFSPSCYHSCCYICNPRNYNDRTGDYEENPWLTKCKRKCELAGDSPARCEAICMGE